MEKEVKRIIGKLVCFLCVLSFTMLTCNAFATGKQVDENVFFSVRYEYAKDVTLIARTVNGEKQNFEYDKRGQLLSVKGSDGKTLERYTYNPAGNILSKTIAGKTTQFYL